MATDRVDTVVVGAVRPGCRSATTWPARSSSMSSSSKRTRRPSVAQPSLGLVHSQHAELADLELPGAEYHGGDPDGFMSREEIVAYLENYAGVSACPSDIATRVSRVERESAKAANISSRPRVATIRACNVVIATGLYQSRRSPLSAPIFPPPSGRFIPTPIATRRSSCPGLCWWSEARNPALRSPRNSMKPEKGLPRRRARRPDPRRYRGKDANWWSEKLGDYDRTVDQLPSPKAKFAGKPHISGTGAATPSTCISLRATASSCSGICKASKNGKLVLAPDLHKTWRRLTVRG